MPDLGGAPDPALANALVPYTPGGDVNRVETGETAFGGAYLEYEYTFSFASPFTFDPGTTYWLGLYMGFNSDGVFWETTNNVTGNPSHYSLLGGFEPNQSDLAFVLYDSNAVPAPAALLLMVAGLLGMGSIRRFSK
jgi:hypothetical protein